jgi:hypothetical protein
MSCAHCCYACTAEGLDMSRDTFIQACKTAEGWGDSLAIGGGEPLLHPLFWDFLGIALAHVSDDDMMPFVATNGSVTQDAVRLANLGKAGVVCAVLSLDEWHDPIEARVVKAFERTRKVDGWVLDQRRDRDCREIRSARPERVVNAGRATWGPEPGCCCEDTLCTPTGDLYLYLCGCQKKACGTIWAPQVPDDFERHCCGSSYEG